MKLKFINRLKRCKWRISLPDLRCGSALFLKCVKLLFMTSPDFISLVVGYALPLKQLLSHLCNKVAYEDFKGLVVAEFLIHQLVIFSSTTYGKMLTSQCHCWILSNLGQGQERGPRGRVALWLASIYWEGIMCLLCHSWQGYLEEWSQSLSSKSWQGAGEGRRSHNTKLTVGSTSFTLA